jgi:hypothetical protein
LPRICSFEPAPSTGQFVADLSQRTVRDLASVNELPAFPSSNDQGTYVLDVAVVVSFFSPANHDIRNSNPTPTQMPESATLKAGKPISSRDRV